MLPPQPGESRWPKPHVSSKNRILSRLSAADKALLQPDLEPVDLALRKVLEAPNKANHAQLFHRLRAGFDRGQEQP